MNTKIWMTLSSLLLALAGGVALFAPEVLLALFGGEATATGLEVLVQLMGGLYFAMAMMNWTAKDSAIGGIYARPVSLANLAHFFIGSLLLLRPVLSAALQGPLLGLFLIYTIFAVYFAWLVFVATGLPKGSTMGGHQT